MERGPVGSPEAFLWTVVTERPQKGAFLFSSTHLTEKPKLQEWSDAPPGVRMITFNFSSSTAKSVGTGLIAREPALRLLSIPQYESRAPAE